MVHAIGNSNWLRFFTQARFTIAEKMITLTQGKTGASACWMY